MSQPIDTPRQRIGTVELRMALEDALNRHSDTRRRITGLERWPTPYSTSFVIEELEVRLDNGTMLELMFKDLSRQALLETARRVKPAFLYDPLREIETYRAILTPDQLGTAICYGTVVDDRLERHWLFLEKVPGIELYQVGEFATWQRVARWLAFMHARFAGETGPLARASPLLRYDSDFYWLWLRRARAFSAGSLRPESSGIEWLAARYDQVVERLTALPATFIHGEFYASNVLVRETATELRVCPIDWEMAAVGPGLIDLAALTAGGWTADEKTALALAYHGALAPRDGWPPSPDTFLTLLDYCHLHLAVQWLGWSPEWSPPPEHARNWLDEALSLAENLGL